MSDNSEIRDAIADRIAEGVAERRIADRQTRYSDPVKDLQALELLSAQRSASGPFVRVGFSSRAL